MTSIQKLKEDFERLLEVADYDSPKNTSRDGIAIVPRDNLIDDIRKLSPTFKRELIQFIENHKDQIFDADQLIKEIQEMRLSFFISREPSEDFNRVKHILKQLNNEVD